MASRRWLGCAVVALVLFGCGEQPRPATTTTTKPRPAATPSSGELMRLASPSIAVGESVVARFSRPLDAAGERYWITVVEAGQPDSQWGVWQYVDRTAREVAVGRAASPGSYEVRLHDRYPEMPHHVVARVALAVTGSPVGSAESQPQPAVTSAPPAPPAAAAQVPESDAAAMAASDYGSPSTRLEPSLYIRAWVKDGGGQELVDAAAGQRFLVVEFNDAATQTAQLYYDSRQVSLRVGADVHPVYAVTTGGASAPRDSVTADGSRVFQREVYASYYAPAPDLPFSLAFQVPAGAAGGTLKLGRREIELSW